MKASIAPMANGLWMSQVGRLDNKLICPDPTPIRVGAELKQRERLEGPRKYYYKTAA
jgi:hypothetical protein